jgi:hypothetical protein
MLKFPPSAHSFVLFTAICVYSCRGGGTERGQGDRPAADGGYLRIGARLFRLPRVQVGGAAIIRLCGATSTYHRFAMWCAAICREHFLQAYDECRFGGCNITATDYAQLQVRATL